MNDKEDLVKEWIHKAVHDLGMAKLALNYNPEYTDAICFHCQQSVEKFLKGWCIESDIEFVKTHSLVYLLDLINEKTPVPDQIYNFAETLEGYAVEVRYPDDLYEPTIEEANEAYHYANEIISYIKQFLKS